MKRQNLIKSVFLCCENFVWKEFLLTIFNSSFIIRDCVSW